MKKKTLTDFLVESSLIHGDKYDYSKVEYVNTKTKVCIICPIHGEFWQTPEKHITRAQGCSKCSGKYKWTTKELINNCIVKYGELYNYDKLEYINSNTKVIITCKIHGDFSIIPYDFLNNKCGCPHCGNNKLTIEKFISLANNIHNNIYDYSKSDVSNWTDKIDIICIKHGIFSQSPVNHIYNKHRCPICKITNQSLLFERLKLDFKEYNIVYEVSLDWLDKQRFDIYFPDLNLAIEYDGEQHYKPIEFFGGEDSFIYQQKMDNLKELKCKQNNCKLIRLKYNYNELDYHNLTKEIIEWLEKRKK